MDFIAFDSHKPLSYRFSLYSIEKDLFSFFSSSANNIERTQIPLENEATETNFRVGNDMIVEIIVFRSSLFSLMFS